MSRNFRLRVLVASASRGPSAELPSRVYNPLFVYGGGGLGKTHLLHAIGHRTGHLFPSTVVVYLSCEHFTAVAGGAAGGGAALQ